MFKEKPVNSAKSHAVPHDWKISTPACLPPSMPVPPASIGTLVFLQRHWRRLRCHIKISLTESWALLRLQGKLISFTLTAALALWSSKKTRLNHLKTATGRRLGWIQIWTTGSLGSQDPSSVRLLATKPKSTDLWFQHQEFSYDL